MSKYLFTVGVCPATPKLVDRTIVHRSTMYKIICYRDDVRIAERRVHKSIGSVPADLQLVLRSMTPTKKLYFVYAPAFPPAAYILEYTAQCVADKLLEEEVKDPYWFETQNN